MNKKLAASVAILLSLATSAFAHRLDEYLQATILSVEKDRVEAFMRLIPGVAVSPAVLSSIDSNRDGVLSEDERRAYAERVLRDVSFTIDGHPVTPRLVSFDFPRTEAIKEGLGEIQIQFRADLPVGDSHRKLIFENHHQSPISAYLMNCLVPSDREIRIIVQKRNPNQSWYQLDYVQAENRPVPLPFRKWWSGTWAPLGVNVGFASIFRLGVRHIAEGTDHLLFLLALLLPAPLLVFGSRWAGYAGVRQSLLQILRVVTAFTVGHSITLALAALELVRVPSRPIEVLIALSILVSAAHAFRPLFPGREAVIAAFFGLIHGLAFATTLGELGLGRWERVASILAFNLGIETMQLVVVTATMPSLLLLSRTHAYSVVRVGGALFAGFAAAGWMAERLLGIQNSVDVIVEGVAHYAVWIAGGLFLISLVCWSLRNALDGQSTATKTRPQATFEQI
ncbi:MAG: HupE/UreJ family protein [Acidobacteriaceae bacterium]|nr:HupE/UreJ family protein [Acidobacteriaceae bacterium]MBV9224194.1 HupE/UreJ family protein [Acidobacteriaceae bacterium]MBV9308343.1 HupE/UreJ family protein [Acidobacteriaceae bacterium]